MCECTGVVESEVDLQQQLNDKDKELKQQIENSDATIKMLKEMVQRLKSQLLSTTAKPVTIKEPTATSFHPIGLGPGMFLTNMYIHCLLYTSPSPRDATLSRMPSSA